MDDDDDDDDDPIDYAMHKLPSTGRSFPFLQFLKGEYSSGVPPPPVGRDS
jgi:hypothetical protein